MPTAYHNLIAGGYLKSGEGDKEVIRSGRERYDADLAELVVTDRPDIVVCVGPPSSAVLEFRGWRSEKE